MCGKIHLLVCNHTEAEARAVLARGGRDFDGVTLSVYPGRCGRPPLTSAQLRELIPKDVAAVEIVGGACLSTLRRSTAPVSECNVNCVRTCFDMFADQKVVARLVRSGAYLLTSGWLGAWQNRFEDWGFDQGSLRGFLRETVTHLHLLDTGIDDDSPRRLAELGAYADRPVEVSQVGLDFFELYLKQIVLKRRLELLAIDARQNAQQLAQKAADYAMAMDLLGQIAATHDERDAIRRMLEVFTMLFAPETIQFVFYEQERPMAMYSPGTPTKPPDAEIVSRLATLSSQATWDEEGGTYRIRIAHAGKIFGILLMARLACPQYAAHYRNLVASIAPICGLAIDNARNYQEMSKTGEALKRANRELVRLAATDELTQVANRRQFDEHLQMEWRRALRRKTPLSLLMIDIDHFKQYNDHWGHQAGDNCLREVAQIIANCVARAGDLAARYGGEEFGLILPQTPLEGAHSVAEKVRTSVVRARLTHGASPVGDYVTLSIGYATLVPESLDGAPALVLAADRALYEAKRNGRNRSCEARGEPSEPVTLP